MTTPAQNIHNPNPATPRKSWIASKCTQPSSFYPRKVSILLLASSWNSFEYKIHYLTSHNFLSPPKPCNLLESSRIPTHNSFWFRLQYFPDLTPLRSWIVSRQVFLLWVKELGLQDDPSFFTGSHFFFHFIWSPFPHHKAGVPCKPRSLINKN